MLKVIRGDLIKLAKEGKFDLIAHGCNCFCNMGAGIAATIKKEFPWAYAADRTTPMGVKEKLGTCTSASKEGLTIVNCYTQYDYGRKGMNADYDAIDSCMQWLARNHKDKRIGLPKIGAGLAGGDWKEILGIIEDRLRDCDVTIVEYDK